MYKRVAQSFIPFLAWTIYLASFLTYGQNLYFNPLEVKNDLTKSDVSCIIQDSNGFLWLGTDDGLNKYDGNKVIKFYTHYNNSNSLSGNRISCLYEDSKKRIWIGTEGNGLNYYSIKDQKIYRVKTPNRYKSITSISQNDSKEIIIGTTKGLLTIKEEQNKLVSEIIQCPLNGVNIYKIVTKGDLNYIATTSGIWIEKNNQYRHIESLENDIYNNIIIDSKNRIWALQRFKIKIATPVEDTYRVQEFKTDYNYAYKTIGLSNDNDIWVGTLNHGLLQINSETIEIKGKYGNNLQEERSLSNYTITYIYCDPTNTLWIANRYGVSYTNLNQKSINSLPLTNIRTKDKIAIIRNMIEDNGYLYFIIQDEKAYRYNIKTKATQYIDLGENTIPFTLKKIKNRIYIGSNNGLYIQKKENSAEFAKKEFKTLHNNHLGKNPSVIGEDKYGNVYYGNYNGLIIQKEDKYNWASNTNISLDILRGKRVFTLLFDDYTNCLWIGTISNGLFKMNFDSKGDFLSIEEYNKQLENNYHIPDNNIWGIYKDSAQNLWVTTDSGLLYLQKKESKFKLVDSENLINKKNMGIVEDPSGNFWVTSSKSLVKYNPKTKKEINYTYSDGLNSNFFTKALCIKDSTIFVGTFRGINSFKYDSINSPKVNYHVNFTNLKIHNHSILPEQVYLGSAPLKKNINLIDEITLNHKQNNFLIEFATNNYVSSYKDKYRYKLKGYNENWIYTDNEHKFASYSNLNRGTYTFLIQLQNLEGNWEKASKEILIKIKPAPWLSWYAYLFYFIVLGCIGYAILYFWSNKQKLKHELELNKIITKKEHDINELKLAFFTDIAHEFKTPLSLIVGPLKGLSFKEIASEKFDFNLHIITRNTQRMMHLVNQLLDFRKINANKNILRVSKGNLANFILEISDYFMWQAQNASINFNIISSENKNCYFDKNIIEKVVYNLLSNAFKYTPNQGTIEIEVKIVWKQDRKFANIIIKDSGKGISDTDKKQIFKRYFHGEDRSSSGIGLHLSYNLIKAHKGEIIAADSSLGGAEFIILIPVEKEHYNENELSENNVKASKKENLLNLTASTSSPENQDIVLIVEDDYDLRYYLKTCLQNNYKVLEASNGIEGLNMAKKEIPDFIISDVMMPEMDGVSMSKKLKENESTSHIPILLLTAKTDEEFKNRGLSAGAWDYIAKPFNTENLLQKVNNIIKTQNRLKQLFTERNYTTSIKKYYTSFDQKLISKLANDIEENMAKSNFSAEELANHVGFSRMQLHRKLKALTGQTTTEFINSIKINYAIHMFDNGCDRIQEAMDAVGISSYSHFNKIFKENKKVSPSEYIKSIGFNNP